MVSYHLHTVYAKLGTTSRGELHRLDLDNRGGRQQTGPAAPPALAAPFCRGAGAGSWVAWSVG
jgi:hypothetical protein